MCSQSNYPAVRPSFMNAAPSMAAQLSRRVLVSRVALFSVLLVGLYGCANASLATARKDIAAGHYASAHRELVAAQQQRLSTSELREVKDDLCLTEYKVGAPVYPFSEQREICAAALQDPGSDSGRIYSELQREELAHLATEVTSAIDTKDITRASLALARYREVPGHNSQLAARWLHQIWTLAERNQLGVHSGRHNYSINRTIAQMQRKYPHLRSMKTATFEQWVIDHTSIHGTRLVSGMRLRGNRLNLWVNPDYYNTVALNLDRFVSVNDALTARCRCDGQTNVAVTGSGLPAYLVRLNPELGGSEILILPAP